LLQTQTELFYPHERVSLGWTAALKNEDCSCVSNCPDGDTEYYGRRRVGAPILLCEQRRQAEPEQLQRRE